LGAPHSGDPDLLDDLAKVWHRETGQALAGTEFEGAITQLADVAEREHTTPLVVFARAVAAFVADCANRKEPRRPKHMWLLNQLAEWIAPPAQKTNGSNGHAVTPIEAEYLASKSEWERVKGGDDEGAKARALERFKKAQREALQHAARKTG
jgi:hypothetical protein